MGDLLPLITLILEREQMPQGPPFAYRSELFTAILEATHDARDKLAKDGLGNDLINQIISNTACHALAVLTLSLDLSQAELIDVFLQYCVDIEAAAKKELRLNS